MIDFRGGASERPSEGDRPRKEMKVLGERKRNRDVEPQRKEEELGRVVVVTIMNQVSFWRAHEMSHVAEWKTGYLI